MRAIMNRQQSFIQQNPTTEKLCSKMQNADDLCSRLRSLLLDEEKKRGNENQLLVFCASKARFYLFFDCRKVVLCN